MVNEDYKQLVRNNDRGTYLKGAGKEKKDPGQEEIAGPILRKENVKK